MDKVDIIGIIVSALLGGALAQPITKWVYKKIDQRKAAKAKKISEKED